ncbi:hypothetical protein Daus18300_005030 [Diaporthe australafricana]|uniref:Heterokaryon incompatibility domain-containing protein n=1 Tax=Diaporthe australafricana TaxID=127596 RepID=A0ABR3X4F5_9PEZI
MLLRPWAAATLRVHSQRRAFASYRYTLLPNASQSLGSGNFIRLLEVQKDDGAGGSASSSNELRCSLRTFKLSNAPEFRALSYTWGDPLTPFSRALSQTSNARSHSKYRAYQHETIDSVPHIVVDSQSLAVTPNLLSALQMLASRSFSASASSPRQHTPPLLRGLSSRPQYFWIDAICVDQSNVSERNAQVAIMADVFRAAQGITIWLGPEDQFTADALDAVQAISPLMALTSPNSDPKARQAWKDISYTDFFGDIWYSRITEATTGLQGSITHYQWLGLLALLSRPWFQRAWVVQELALARQATILILAHRELHMLSYVQDASLTVLGGLPSWVPDFSVQLAPYPLSFRGAVSWSACGGSMWMPPASDEDMMRGILRVQGYKVGEVEEIALLQHEAECSAEFWASIVDWRWVSMRNIPSFPTGQRLEQSPTPEVCGNLFIDYILNLQIRHTLAPWSDIDFMPHQSHTHADNIQPRWHDLLRSEPEGFAVYKSRMTTVMENIFQGTYSPMDLAQLQHEFDYGSGSSRRLFRTDNGLLGTGLKSVRKGDEVWILAGSKLPMLMRKKSASEHGSEYCLIGETYVHGVMHWQDDERNLPELQNIVLK